jgi:pheromone receptor transcription factor
MGSQKKMITKGKKSIGRQRIEIKLLEEESKKQVTFSKRRSGLFKKAAELCILCGAEVAVIAYSTHGNVFCFGHPDVETVVNRYLSGNTCCPSKSLNNVVPVDDFNRQHAEAQKELEKEKKRLKEIVERQAKEKNGGFWWDEPLDENMGLEEMEEYLRALTEVRRKVAARVEEFRMARTSLLQPVDMAAGLGNYINGLGNDFVIQDLEGGSGSTGFVGSHGHGQGYGYGFGFGHGQI